MSKHKSSQKQEILWNIINSSLAGILVLLGALTSGEISPESICIALVTAFIVAITQFKDYWTNEKREYSNTKLFAFIRL